MTQAELAKKAGISLKTLSRYENGEKISFNSEKKLLITLEIDNAQSLENYAEKTNIHLIIKLRNIINSNLLLKRNI